MSGSHAVLAGAVFVVALVAIVTRPRGVGEAWWAAGGAVLMLAVGAVSPAGALATLVAHRNLFLFLLGLMAIAGLADAAGIFDATGAIASPRAAAAACSSPRSAPAP